MLQELDNLKKENAAIFSEKEYYLSECEHLKSENLSINNQLGVLSQELTDIKGQLYQAQQELSEAESVVQECVEEKKKLTSVNSNGKKNILRPTFSPLNGKSWLLNHVIYIRN